MTGLRLELGNPNAYSSVQDYVKEHVAPVVTELHRLTNELLAPGATSAEEWSVDMIPPPLKRGQFARLDRHLQNTAKNVFFDGSTFLDVPAEILQRKQLKVQLQATVYKHDPNGVGGSVRFRLVDEHGWHIQGSSMHTDSSDPVTIHSTLAFGRDGHSVKPGPARYYIEASTSNERVIPVCRRLSMSFVYI